MLSFLMILLLQVVISANEQDDYTAVQIQMIKCTKDYYRCEKSPWLKEDCFDNYNKCEVGALESNGFELLDDPRKEQREWDYLAQMERQVAD